MPSSTEVSKTTRAYTLRGMGAQFFLTEASYMFIVLTRCENLWYNYLKKISQGVKKETETLRYVDNGADAPEFCLLDRQSKYPNFSNLPKQLCHRGQ